MKKFLLVFMAIFCLFGLLACDGKNEVDDIFEYKSAEDIKNHRGTIEIDFRVPSGTISTALKNIIPKFEAEWDGKIKVNLDAISGSYDGLLEQNVYDLNQGKAPTMTIGYPDHFALYLSGGGLLSLQPYMDKENFDIDDFIQPYLPENQLADDNDDYYGLPLNKSTEVMIYNATVFEAMEYELPATWEEYEELGEQIIEDAKSGKFDEIEAIKYSETDKKPSYYVEKGLFYPLSYDSTDNAFITMCRQWGAQYTERDTMSKGYAMFNNDEAKAGLAYFQDLAERKLFAVAENFDESYASNAFKNLQCIITIGSSAGISLENATLFARQDEMLKEQKVVFDSFINTLAASIDARDKITSGHSTRVRMYATLIAEAFNMPANEIEIIQKAAALHDIGKIGIKDSVLQKEGKLTPEEYQHIQQHVEITHNILEKIHMSEEFSLITEIACSHHEKYDGTGYYRQLKGEEIPFGGRVLAVSDVFDAITSKRHYRDKMPMIKVLSILIGDSGTHFDKNVVDKFLSITLDKIVRVFLTENHLALPQEDVDYLKQYTFADLYNYMNSGENNELVDKFNFYYIGCPVDAVNS